MERALRKTLGWAEAAEPDEEPAEKPAVDEETRLRNLFNEMDTDGSGTLERAEVANLCKEINRRPLSEEELDAAMEDM